MWQANNLPMGSERHVEAAPRDDLEIGGRRTSLTVCCLSCHSPRHIKLPVHCRLQTYHNVWRPHSPLTRGGDCPRGSLCLREHQHRRFGFHRHWQQNL